jgi:hypothetical protein
LGNIEKIFKRLKLFKILKYFENIWKNVDKIIEKKYREKF